MAKRKSNSRGKSGEKSRRRPWWAGLFLFLVLMPLRYWRITLGVIIIGLLYWQRTNLVSLANSITTAIWSLFGWGLALIALAIGTLVAVVWLGKLPSLLHQGNRWLGGIVFTLALWGVLALFNLGGSFGLGIIGSADFIGVLRILGLVLIGVILAAPKVSFRLMAKLVVKSLAWLREQWQKREAPQPTSEPKLSVPSVGVRDKLPKMEKRLAVGSEKDEPEEKEATRTRAAGSAPRELKQVAQEVWKKYGESADVVTVDGWRLPPIDILDRSPEIQFSQADNLKRAKLIEEALSSYGVDAKVVQINAGPTVTQFGVEPGWDRKLKQVKEKDKDGNVTMRVDEVSKTRVKVERITSLGNDLALALAASSIRIEAPVPGKAVVGVEVPNTVSSVVSLRGVIETSVFQKIQSRSKLSLALGKGAGGEAVAADLAKLPHLLVAGATGSGKTVCLDAIICCLLLYNTPNDVRFILIDPKRVELTMFNSIPHLATPVIVDAEKALDALRWLSQEMDKRYQTLAAFGQRNIEGYNKNKQGEQKMPYLVLIIDELADLMMLGGDEVERILCRLAQLARAVGIHLVVATQRPSVDVVTGLIKANFPTRISFAVTSQVDSRTILDGGGAEKLLGKGDMLYMPTEAAKPKRLQGCYVSDAEVERLVYLWGNQRQEGMTSLKIGELAPSRLATGKGALSEDPILKSARQLAQEHPKISASFLQRRLRIGYPRAARIIDQLEEEKAIEGGGKEEGDEGEEHQSSE
ncbi:MAG: DNA translocase FtsK [Chloroflexi bacterium]|nr:DNA translocase FtsK [Chloroflexota bacterium]